MISVPSVAVVVFAVVARGRRPAVPSLREIFGGAPLSFAEAVVARGSLADGFGGQRPAVFPIEEFTRGLIMRPRLPVARLDADARGFALGVSLAVGTLAAPTVCVIFPGVAVAHARLGDGRVCDCLADVGVGGVGGATENLLHGRYDFIGNFGVRLQPPGQAPRDGRARRVRSRHRASVRERSGGPSATVVGRCVFFCVCSRDQTFARFAFVVAFARLRGLHGIAVIPTFHADDRA
mmetsp:Transcript_14732/g.63236  ORF Transcript_14732/g.63236 Transcript_14732/m.63236 type:complete len:236 (+) Transcript_14732:3804-4511(+)